MVVLNGIDLKIDLSDQVINWLEKEIGHFSFEFIELGSKGRTQTWRVKTRSDVYYFKLYESRLNWQHEIFAYKNWSGAYAPNVPVLCGEFENDTLPGILVTGIDGNPLREGNYSSEEIAAVYEFAGRLCRHLEEYAVGLRFGLPKYDNYQWSILDHRIYPQITSDNPVEYVRNRYLTLLESAKKFHALDPQEMEITLEALDLIDVFSGEKPVPVNSDFTPGNWLVNKYNRFAGVIDLESITWDVPIFSLTRLISKYFPFQENGRKAFYRGYQGNLELEKPEQVRIVIIMDGLRYLIKGFDDNNLQNISRGRNIFQLIKE